MSKKALTLFQDKDEVKKSKRKSKTADYYKQRFGQVRKAKMKILQ